jgi:tetratricopeptide (TPR) repeat protein
MGLFDFLKKKEFEEIIQLKKQLEKYKPISDIEKEVERQNQKLALDISAKTRELGKIDIDYNTLKSNYQNALETYTNLRKEIGLYENKLDLVEFGVYEPVYDFEKSDDYRAEQSKIIELQKQKIANETAATCTANWTIDGSEAKGKASTKRFIKLMLRAFNGECDALIAKVKWNNVGQMQERIKKSFEAINKLGESQKTYIEISYRDLKLKELILEHEYQLKRQKEKEELRSAQEELREEEKARREFEQAQKQAEKEEANYEKALEKARKEVEETTGEKQQKLQMKIELLEQELREAHERKERAISMAQQTKRGHVYIISNIGSFGENVFKIGMTRRLEPTDRVRELGDASVPFQFDIHSQQKIGTSCGRFGKLSFVCYI